MQAYGIGAQYNYKTYSGSLYTNRSWQPQGQQRNISDALEVESRGTRRHKPFIGMTETAPEDMEGVLESTEQEFDFEQLWLIFMECFQKPLENYDPYAYLNAKHVEGFIVVENKPAVWFSDGPAPDSYEKENATYDPRLDELERRIDNLTYSARSPEDRAVATHIATIGFWHEMQFYNYYDDVYGSVANIRSSLSLRGLSDSEKYMAIYNAYQQAFGEDFYIGNAIQYPANGTSTLIKIKFEFYNDLKSAFGSLENAEAAYKVALYGDMTDTEVRAEIMAKYPPMDRITLREFHYLVWEMDSVGVAGDLNNVLFMATMYYGPNDVNAYLMREDLLDRRLDIGRICHEYNCMRYAEFAKTETRSILCEMFGVSFSSGGQVDHAQYPISINYDELARQINEYLQSRRALSEDELFDELCKRWPPKQ